MSFSRQGFSLIEILIVITVLGILSTMLLNAMGGMAGKQARDANRISDIQQLATLIKSKQNQFHTPPLSGQESSKYPPVCKGTAHADLGKCLQALKVADSDESLNQLLSDPKQDVEVEGNNTHQYSYFYWADKNSFKLCTFLEDQGAFDKLNATSSGMEMSSSQGTSENEVYMYCHFEGPTARSTSGTLAKIALVSN